VPAQKLFFAHSEAGDLGPLLSGYFDTETGPKREAESYRRIATSIGVPAGEILFLSDIVEELDAAAAAGLHTTQIARPPATCPNTGVHVCVADFDAVTA
jgi:enolase-phosphatase E1